MSKIKIQSEYDDLDKYENEYGHIFYYKKDTQIFHNPYDAAILFKSGNKEYIIEDKYHRLDGPARIWADGYTEYYIDHKFLTKEQFELNPKRLKFLGKEYLLCLK